MKGSIVDEVHQQINPWIYQVCSCFSLTITYKMIYIRPCYACYIMCQRVIFFCADNQSLQEQGVRRNRIHCKYQSIGTCKWVPQSDFIFITVYPLRPHLWSYPRIQLFLSSFTSVLFILKILSLIIFCRWGRYLYKMGLEKKWSQRLQLTLLPIKHFTLTQMVVISSKGYAKNTILKKLLPFLICLI